MHASRGLLGCCTKDCQICFQPILTGGISIEHTNDQDILSDSSICYCNGCWVQYRASGKNSCPHCRQSLQSPSIVLHTIDCGRQQIPIHFEDGRLFYATSTHTVRDVLHALPVTVYTRLSHHDLILVDLDRSLLDMGVLEEPTVQMKLVDLHELLLRAMQSGNRTLFMQILGHMEPEMDQSVCHHIERLLFDVVGLQLRYIRTPSKMHAHTRIVAFTATLGYVIRLRIRIKAGSPIVLLGIDAGLQDAMLVTVDQFQRPFFDFDPDEILVPMTIEDENKETTVRDMYTSMVDGYTTDLFRRVLAISAHVGLYMEIDFRRLARMEFFASTFNTLIKTDGGQMHLTNDQQTTEAPDIVVSDGMGTQLTVTTKDGTTRTDQPLPCVLYILRKTYPSRLYVVVHGVEDSGRYSDPTSYLSLTRHGLYTERLIGTFGPVF